MKITQLDYSAIRAANSAQANANSMALAVETQKHNNLMTKYNVEYTDKYIKAVNKENNAKRWIQFGTDVANLALKGAAIGIKYKDQADGETASNAITDAADALNNTYNQEYQNNAASFFDADNNIVKPQAIIDQENAIRNSIQNLNIGNGKKEEALAAVDEMFSKAWSDVGEQLAGREIQARNEAWITRLNDALEVDSTLGTPDNGLEMIQNTSWLTPAEKENYSLQYKNSFEARVQSNEVSRLARESGEETANDYIKGLSIDETAKNTLYSLADSIAKDGDENAQGNMQSYVQQQLEKGIFPVVIAEMVEPQLENMDLSRREAVETVMHQAFYDNAVEAFDVPDDITTLSGEQLRTLQTNLAEKGETMLPDMPTELNSLKATVQNEIDRRDKLNLDNNLENLDLLYNSAGVTQAPSAVLAQLLSTDPEDIPSKALSTKSSEDDQKITELVGKLYNREDFIPSQYKQLYKDSTDNLADLIKTTYDIDMDAPEDIQQYSSLKGQVFGRFLDYFWYTDPQDITEEGIMAAYEKAKNIYFGENMERLEKLRNKYGDRTFIEDGLGEYSAELLSKYSDIALDAPDGMIEQNPDNAGNGEYTFAAPAYGTVWAEAAVLIKDSVSAYTGEDVSGWTLTPYTVRNADGSTSKKPWPIIESPDGSTRYTVLGNSLMMKTTKNGPWQAIHNFESNPNPRHPVPSYQAPVSVDVPRRLLSDGEGGYIDETELLPEENNVISLVQSLERETPTEKETPRTVVEETVEPVEYQEKKPSVPIRLVKGSGTEFWYEGKWYLVNDLTENSNVMNAYDKFIRTFKGKIPRVGY